MILPTVLAGLQAHLPHPSWVRLPHTQKVSSIRVTPTIEGYDVRVSINVHHSNLDLELGLGMDLEPLPDGVSARGLERHPDLTYQVASAPELQDPTDLETYLGPVIVRRYEADDGRVWWIITPRIRDLSGRLVLLDEDGRNPRRYQA